MASLPILVVDDQPFPRRSVASALRSLGRQVVEASSSAEAAFVLAQQRISMVISDYQLRDGTTGLDVLERVRQSDPDAFRVLMSGDPPPGIALAVDSGVVHTFCLKPFGIDELRRVLSAAEGSTTG